jgi:hypothetical protein
MPINEAKPKVSGLYALRTQDAENFALVNHRFYRHPDNCISSNR